MKPNRITPRLCVLPISVLENFPAAHSAQGSGGHREPTDETMKPNRMTPRLCVLPISVLENFPAPHSAQSSGGHREPTDETMKPNRITYASVSSQSLCWKTSRPRIERRVLEDTEN